MVRENEDMTHLFTPSSSRSHVHSHILPHVITFIHLTCVMQIVILSRQIAFITRDNERYHEAGE